MFEIGVAVISVVQSPDKHLPQTNIYCVPKSSYQLVQCSLFGVSLSGFVFFSASRKAAIHFDAKLCSRMNTRSVSEYTTFAPADICANGVELRPSDKSGLDSNVSGRSQGGLLYGFRPASDLIFYRSNLRDYRWVTFQMLHPIAYRGCTGIQAWCQAYMLLHEEMQCTQSG